MIFSGIPPFIWPIIALIAIIAYRFISPNRTMSIHIGLILKAKDQPDTTVQVRQFMIVAITIIVLVASLYIILSRKYDESAEKWAYGTIGLILGYWLKK